MECSGDECCSIAGGITEP
uniref:Uncharacterized protein n=1 Tax=Anguilla anguilla TaxID=7936 RepID=A0A0E9VEG9_ANGAN